MSDRLYWNDAEAWDEVAHFSQITDFSKEFLKVHGNPRREWALMQAECRYRAIRKIPSLIKNSRFVFPTRLSVEQCTSESLAKWHASLVSPSGNGLDITCGLGIDAMTLAKYSESIMALEQNPIVAEAVEFNARLLGLDNIKCICAECVDWVNNNRDRHFDWIFADPARRRNGGQRIYSIEECSPDVVALLSTLLNMSPKVIIKASPMLDIKETERCLGGVAAIYTVGTPTECKEIVAVVVERNNGLTCAEHYAVTITHDGATHEVNISDNPIFESVYAESIKPGNILYEPWPSVMKYQADGWLCNRYGVMQLAPSTHIYVSEKLIVEFPGRCYRIISVSGYSKHECESVGREFPKINVTARNFPDAHDKIIKRLRIKEGGNMRLFAVTGPSGKKLLIICAE